MKCFLLRKFVRLKIWLRFLYSYYIFICNLAVELCVFLLFVNMCHALEMSMIYKSLEVLLHCTFQCRTHIRIPAIGIMEHSEVHFCRITLKAMKSIGCWGGRLTLDWSLPSAGQTRQVMTTPWYGMIYITSPKSADSKLRSWHLFLV